MDLAYWLLPHDIDVMRWVTGSEVREVSAKTRDRMRTADDYLIVNLRFGSGVDAVLESSWCSPPLSGAMRSAAFEVWGTEGHVSVDDSEMNVRVFSPDDRVQSLDTYEDFEVAGASHGIFGSLIDHFVARVSDSRPATMSVADAVAAVRVCEMIAQSVETGEPVRVARGA